MYLERNLALRVVLELEEVELSVENTAGRLLQCFG